MIGSLILFFAILVFFYLFLKGVGSLFKGIILLTISILLLLIVFKNLSYLEEMGRGISTIPRFLNVSYDRLSSRFFSVRIVHYFREGDFLYLVLENSGIFPLTKIEVYLDEEKAQIISKPNLFLPNALTTIKVVYRNFSSLRVVSNNCEAVYTK